MEATKRLLILGGTFNPIHSGHIKAAVELEKQYHPDGVLFIPTNLPPHKAVGADFVSGEHRLEMIRRAIQDRPGYQVSDMELRRGGKSYTVDTLTQLRQEYPGYQLYFVMGTDMLLSFESWREFRKIFSLCTLVAASREKEGRPVLEAEAQRLRQQYGAHIQVVDVDPVEVSSTQIRSRLRQGQPVTGWIPGPVEEYIVQQGLYREE
ncbi:MAG: nicotinate-nucleotide adenylyltransferase [Eubacteriales bacterium]|jgi:nicotinate-nucleotide adenylyltransferase